VSLEANGKFTFNADFTDIVSVEPGGRVQIETDDGDVTKRLVLRGAGGTIERRFTVDGDDTPYDAAWLASTLLHLLRSSGYAADERAAAIIARQGIAGLVAELEFFHSDYTMRKYIEGGLKAPGVDLAGKQQLIQRGARTIESDYELAELLIAGTKLRPRSRDLWSTITTAAGRIESSYERRRVLSSALHDADVDDQIAQDVLQAAGGIESDYELAELLIDVQRSHAITGAIRPAFAAAVETIESDYERRRVLTPTVDAATPEAVLATAVELAGSMSSDYELAELLISVGPRVAGTVVRPYFAAVSQISSDYEKRRTLDALLRKNALDSTMVGEVLRASQTMSSDYERAELLVNVARGQRLEGKIRELYLDAADGIQSQYEQDRALAALARRRR
jgi:hypothetical protein